MEEEESRERNRRLLTPRVRKPNPATQFGWSLIPHPKGEGTGWRRKIRRGEEKLECC